MCTCVFVFHLPYSIVVNIKWDNPVYAAMSSSDERRDSAVIKKFVDLSSNCKAKG